MQTTETSVFGPEGLELERLVVDRRHVTLFVAYHGERGEVPRVRSLL